MCSTPTNFIQLALDHSDDSMITIIPRTDEDVSERAQKYHPFVNVAMGRILLAPATQHPCDTKVGWFQLSGLFVEDNFVGAG
jgi:hypothetical protein